VRERNGFQVSIGSRRGGSARMPRRLPVSRALSMPVRSR